MKTYYIKSLLKLIAMQKLFTSLFFLVMLNLQLQAQRTISGTITDDKEPLIGATVKIQSTAIGTTTDINGYFELKDITAKVVILEISYTGYKTQIFNVGSSTSTLDVRLESDPYQLKDVVVTANKKAQTIQTTPLAITALSPVQLRRTGAKQFRDFASGIPNLSFGTQGSDGGGRYSGEISIRGISGMNTTAMYLDETPLPESVTPNLIDVTRVEVLKGPQGTLYGSATMAGAVKVITNNPNPNQTEGSFGFSGSAVQEGDLNSGLQGVFNQPITKQLALRVSGYYDFESGVYDRIVNSNVDIINSETRLTEDFYGDPMNIITDGCTGCSFEDKDNFDDKTNYGFNASLGYYPTKNISIIPKVIYQRENGDGYDFAEGNVDNFTQTSNTGLDETFEDEWIHYSLNIEAKFGHGKLVSSTSYFDRLYSEVEDVTDINTIWWMEYEDESIDDGDAIWADDVVRSVGTKLFQQELRYESNYDGKFNFLLGGFYRAEKNEWLYLDERLGMSTYLLSDNAFDPVDCPDCAWDYDHVVANLNAPWYSYDGHFNDSELAVFGQFYYDITSRLKATLGFRYSSATQAKDIVENGADFGFMPLGLEDSNTETSFNPKFNLSYQINKDKMLYATVVKGFRLGDINENLPSFCQDELTANGETLPRFFSSDYVWNYELGFKGVWADGRLVTNAAAFYNQWGNLQQYRFLDCGWGYTSNVGAAQTTGLELDVRFKATKELELSGGIGWMDPVITEAGEFLEAEVGDRILYSPTLTGNLMLNYYRILENKNAVYTTIGMQYASERLGTYTPEDDTENIYPAYALVNARIGFQIRKYDLSIFANNLTNKQANFGNIQSFAGNVPNKPRFATNRPRTIGVEGRVYF
ncbi:MAG: TonB-dependent receptor [Saprospiraceae bacterium]